VGLSHDQQSSLANLGTVVVLIPALDLQASGSAWEHEPNVPPAQKLVRQFNLSAQTVRCFRDNTVALHRLLAAPGARSGSLSKLGRQLYSPHEARAIR
jgi:hypothetical protein